MEAPRHLFRVRTVTAFLSLQPTDFASSVKDDAVPPPIQDTMARAAKLLQTVQRDLEEAGYEVQTVRLATNSFGEYLINPNDAGTTSDEEPANKKARQDMLATATQRLAKLDALLQQHNIQFCALGPATSISEIDNLCATIVQSSPRISCSANLNAGDVVTATAAANCIHRISQHGNGLDNFRFCVTAACCQPYIPFFPAAKSESATTRGHHHDGMVGFAVGLENGALARTLLAKAGSLDNIRTDFCAQLAAALLPVQEICDRHSSHYPFLGIDTSLNPSLEEGGSVAEAMEQVAEIDSFGDPGTLAVAAAITQSLQSLPGIRRTGYCGLMLPVCEDQRLADLASKQRLALPDLLSISSVCGVGVDTVPLAGDCSMQRLTGLLLDMAGLADRWQKSLSCRVLPFPGKHVGDQTDFDSPYMVNTSVFHL